MLCSLDGSERDGICFLLTAGSFQESNEGLVPNGELTIAVAALLSTRLSVTARGPLRRSLFFGMGLTDGRRGHSSRRSRISGAPTASPCAWQ